MRMTRESRERMSRRLPPSERKCRIYSYCKWLDSKYLPMLRPPMSPAVLPLYSIGVKEQLLEVI